MRKLTLKKRRPKEYIKQSKKTQDSPMNIFHHSTDEKTTFLRIEQSAFTYSKYFVPLDHPDSIFKDKTVAELGCGNGWITIAIAEKWLPAKVYSCGFQPIGVN